MIYDIRLRMEYRYDHPVAGGRHAVRALPLERDGTQRVIASELRFDPPPTEREDGLDFFGNRVAACVYREAHSRLAIQMDARVERARSDAPRRGSCLEDLKAELRSVLSLAGDSPHHFSRSSSAAPALPEIAAYARKSVASDRGAGEIAHDLMSRIHADFAYDPDATDVHTSPDEAFRLRRGVCQDFSHVMIAGLRGIGIPAGYVSGFLRTIPPPGRERLEGADAMHAWVRAWCGAGEGWIELDPTNAIGAGEDHVAIGIGRDYADVAPIIGRLRMQGGQKGSQAVDVTPIE